MAYESRGNYFGTDQYDITSHIPREDAAVTTPYHEVGARTFDINPYAAMIPRRKDEVTRIHDATMVPIDNKSPFGYDRMHQIPMVGQAIKQHVDTPFSSQAQRYHDVQDRLKDMPHTVDHVYTKAHKGQSQPTWVLMGDREIPMPIYHGGPMTDRPRLRAEQDVSGVTTLHNNHQMRFRPQLETSQPSIMHHLGRQFERANQNYMLLDKDPYEAFAPRHDSMLDVYPTMGEHDTDHHVTESDLWV